MDFAQSHFNFFDVFVLSVIGFSLVIGFFRGAVRECLGIAAWGGAIFLTLQNFSFPQEILKDFVKDDLLRMVIAQVVIFIFFLVLFLSLAQWLSYYVQNSLAQSIDRSLGLLFGLLRGVLLVCGVYIVSLGFTKHPVLVQTSRSVVFLDQAVVFLKKFLPDSWQSRKMFQSNMESILKKQLDPAELVKKLSSPVSE